MLVLTRNIGEVVKIGDDITIAILGVKGNQVRIGIEAPSKIPVHREEIYNKIKAGEKPKKYNEQRPMYIHNHR